MTFRLQRQKSGALAVHSAAYAETMHPGDGPWEEANRLYVQGSGLAGLLCEPYAPGAAPPSAEALVLFDVGLGAAANALAAVTCHDTLRRAGRHPRPLRIVSFEADGAAPRFALEEAEALRYPRGHEAALAALLADGHAEPGPGIAWELRLGDFTRLVREETAQADVIFFDPFSPRANPDMWTVATLDALYGCRRRAGPGRLCTYSTAFGTRAGLLLAGFYAGEGPRLPGRRGTTVAAAWFTELEQPLTPAWLARWRHDREPWPPGTAPEAYRRLRAALLEHPQWEHFGEATASAGAAGGDARSGVAAPRASRGKRTSRRRPAHGRRRGAGKADAGRG